MVFVDLIVVVLWLDIVIETRENGGQRERESRGEEQREIPFVSQL